MTPEERLSRMLDANRWELEPFRPDFAPAVSVAVPSSRRGWTIGLVSLVTIIVAALVVFGAISLRGTVNSHPIAPLPTETSAPTSTPTPPAPSPTPTSTPTKTALPPAPRTDGARPPQVFDGDCRTIMSNATAATILGTAVASDYDDFTGKTSTHDPNVSPDDWATFPIAENGGILCTWSADWPDQDLPYPGSIRIFAAPAGAVTAEPEAACAAFTPNIGNRGCEFRVTVDGVHIVGAVAAPTQSRARAMAASVHDRVVAASDGAAVTPPVNPAGTWAPSSSCDDVLDSFSGIRSDLFTTANTAYGLGKRSVEEDQLIASTLGVAGTCELWAPSPDQQPGDQYADVTVYPGGAWLRDLVAERPRAQKLTVSGFDAVIGTETHGGPNELWFFHGPNLVTIQIWKPEEKIYYPALRALVVQLDASAR